MEFYDRLERLVAKLYVKQLLEKMKPFEVRNYIEKLSQEELFNKINHKDYKLDKYYLSLFCSTEAFNNCF